MQDKTIRVLVVDDSEVARQLLGHIIESDPKLKVVGYCKTGEEVLKRIDTLKPDVITLDINLPGMDGFEVAKIIMHSYPIPIVIVSGAYTSQDTAKSFKAIEVGALAILEKPAGIGSESYQEKVREIKETIKTISGLKLIKRISPYTSKVKRKIEVENRQIEVVGIGTSLGGPQALSVILSQLSPQFPIPIFIVQHIAIGFTEGLASWLQKFTQIPVKIPKNGDDARPGVIYVAPEKCHMEILKGNKIHLDYTVTKDIQPSVDRLFASLAANYGPKSVGVILTGMGRDGARELLTMKQKGAFTIAQDQESCIMFGMPREAIALGAAKKIVPLGQIAEVLNKLVGIGIKESVEQNR